jgi:DNA mismatch repair protein MLH3
VSTELSFPIDSLRHAKSLGQVDRKFIACILGSKRGKTLVLLDQHAADERVSVEGILQGLCEGFMRDEIEYTILSRTTPRIVLSREEALVLSDPSVMDVFRRWGILLEVEEGDGDYVQVGVRAVPTILLSRLGRQEGSEMTRLVKLYLPILKDSSRELEVALRDGEADWGRMMRWMPKEMLELANSKACRGESWYLANLRLMVIGAIMFGDELDMDQCQRLVARLSETRCPFICAHGRPSLVPLIILGDRGGEARGVGGRRDDKARRQINWAAWKGT